MKPLLRLKAVLLAACLVVPMMAVPSRAQIILRNPVLEFCTGTWCQYCPCGHSIIENTILPNIPVAIIISYHGPANDASDPYTTFNGNSIISALGFTAYPTGIVDRTSTAPIDRGSWYSSMNTRWNIWATVDISMNKTYDAGTRTLSGTVALKAVSQLSGTYMLNLILLEDSLFYAQTGNSGCPTHSPYQHDAVVRTMLNGYLGDTLNTTSPWGVGHIISKTFSYVIPANYVDSHCKLVAFVYKVNNPLSAGEIQQAAEWPLPGTVTAVKEQGAVPSTFALSQNYPNPFNPTTSFDYSVSKQTAVSIKVYNLLGQEVRTLVSGDVPAGTYKATWDGQDNDGRVVPSGMYLYKMTAGGFTESKKMMLLK